MQQHGNSFFIPPIVLPGLICFEAGVLIILFSTIWEDFIKQALLIPNNIWVHEV